MRESPSETSDAAVPFVDLGHAWDEVGTDFLARVAELGERSEFVLSRTVAEFENAFAEYCESACAVGVNSGTDALALGLRALGVGAGDEVILPVNTFVATAEAVVLAGATPVFADVDEASKNLDPKQVEARLTPATRAMIPVHLYGNPAPMAPLLHVAWNADLLVVEDACQAHGARYHGAAVGSLGHVAAFSFYPGKNLGAFGDAGAVVTSDVEVDARLRALRNHGSAERYRHDRIGTNSRLDAIQAAALLCKLPHLERWNAARARAAETYRECLAGLGWLLRIPETTAGSEPVHHLFPIELVDEAFDRDDLLRHLAERGIGCGVHYPTPLHLTPAFAHLGQRAGEFPVAERTMARQLSLPMHPALTPEQIGRVCAAIHEFGGSR